MRIDLTAFPAALEPDPRVLADALNVEILQEVSPSQLHLAVATLVEVGTHDDWTEQELAQVREIFMRHVVGDAPEFLGSERESTDALSPLTFATYVAYAETAIVEESPTRRVSPAAVAASKLSSRLLLGGTGATGTGSAISYLAGGGHGPMVMIIGAATTLVLATSGAALTLLTHWAAKRLEI